MRQGGHYVWVLVPLGAQSDGDFYLPWPFEDAIQDALAQAGIGAEWQSGSAGQDRCDYCLHVSEFKRTLDVILPTLRMADAPPDTAVRAGDVFTGRSAEDNEYRETARYRLGDLERG